MVRYLIHLLQDLLVSARVEIAWSMVGEAEEPAGEAAETEVR